jgi:hypothetical protein
MQGFVDILRHGQHSSDLSLLGIRWRCGSAALAVLPLSQLEEGHGMGDGMLAWQGR